MDARRAEAAWAQTSYPSLFELLQKIGVALVARREARTTILDVNAVLPVTTSFSSRTSLSQHRFRGILSTGVAVDVLTTQAEGNVRFSGAMALRAAAAGGSAQDARDMLRNEVVAARLYAVELTSVVLVRMLAWAAPCIYIAYAGIRGINQQYPGIRITGDSAPLQLLAPLPSFRGWLALACGLTVVAALSHLLRTFFRLRILGTAIDVLGMGAPASLPPGGAPEEGSAGKAPPPPPTPAGSGGGGGAAAAVANPLAAASAAASPPLPPPTTTPASGPLEWAAPRQQPPPPPPHWRQQSFAEAVEALGAGIAPSTLSARWGAALGELHRVRDLERTRAVAQALGLVLAALGVVGALAFAVTGLNSVGAYRVFMGGALGFAWVVGWLPALLAARGGVETTLAVAEAARVAAAGLRLGQAISAPPRCSWRACLRVLYCPCRLMRESPRRD